MLIPLLLLIALPLRHYLVVAAAAIALL